jgi:hypothetical protein
MYIQTNNEGNIIQLISIGDKPEENGYEIPNDTPEEILKNIFSYKYINGEFVYKTEVDATKLNKVKETKLKSLSDSCKNLIEYGIDFNGEHFSLTEDDQINIMSLSSDAQLSLLTGSEIDPIMYHADGKECRVFSVEEIIGIATLSKKYIKYHTTYFNLIKQMIVNIETIDEIVSINYGQELNETYVTKLNEIMGGDSSTYGFEIQLIEDKVNYNNIINDIDINLIKYPSPEKEEIISDESEDDTIVEA